MFALSKETTWQCLSLSDLNFLDLVVQATDVGVGFLWSLLQLHDCHHGVSVISQHPHHRMDLTHTYREGL